jgi:hydrogenase maturation protease
MVPKAEQENPKVQPNPSRPRIRVVCCGSPFAGDDALGLAAAPILREKLAPTVEVLEVGTPGLRLLDIMEGADLCIIVDCMVGGGNPGQIRRLTPEELAECNISFTSAHGVGVAEALSLGMTVEPERLPKNIVIFAVEASNVDKFTEGLSDPVRHALPMLVDAVTEEIWRFEQSYARERTCEKTDGTGAG